MAVKLTDTIEANLLNNRKLQLFPRWDIASSVVMVAPYYSAEEYLAHNTAMKMIGSSDWHGFGEDEMLFSPETLELVSVRLKAIGVSQITANNLPNSWAALTPKIGLLQLDSVQQFYLEAAKNRWIADDGSLLACIKEIGLKSTANRLRLRIAQDFDLLFNEGSLCGWLLANPIYYMVEGWDQVHPISSDQYIGGWVYEYLNLTSHESIEKMEERKPEVFHDLRELIDRITLDDGAIYQRKILQNRIKEIITTFYDIF